MLIASIKSHCVINIKSESISENETVLCQYKTCKIQSLNVKCWSAQIWKYLPRSVKVCQDQIVKLSNYHNIKCHIYMWYQIRLAQRLFTGFQYFFNDFLHILPHAHSPSLILTLIHQVFCESLLSCQDLCWPAVPGDDSGGEHGLKVFLYQIIFPLIYVLIVYFMTAQPLDPARSS